MRKLLVLILCFAMTVILYGCSSKNNDSAATESPAALPSTTSDHTNDADNMADDVTDGAKDLGEGAGDVVKDAGDAVEDAGDAVGGAIQDMTGNDNTDNNQ